MNLTHEKVLPRKEMFYIPAFDGIRCIAVFFVMLLHGSYGFFIGGWVGVDLFFVLSGYLITSLLIAEYKKYNKINFKNFWVRRALKLIPALLCLICLTNIVWRYLPDTNGTKKLLASIASLFYFSNFLNPKILGAFSHLWSLSVEEHFYIIWPLVLIFFLFKHNNKYTKKFLIICIAVVFLMRLAGYYYYFNTNLLTGNTIEIDPYRNTIFRMDSILCGCFMGLFYNHKPVKKSVLFFLNIVAAIFLISTLLFVNELAIWFQQGGFILINLLCVAVVYIALSQPMHTILSNRILRYFGKRSYGIYLYHFAIFSLFEKMRINHSMSNLIVVTLLRFFVTFFIAELSYRFIENPVLKLKKRFSPTYYSAVVK